MGYALIFEETVLLERPVALSVDTTPGGLQAVGATMRNGAVVVVVRFGLNVGATGAAYSTLAAIAPAVALHDAGVLDLRPLVVEALAAHESAVLLTRADRTRAQNAAAESVGERMGRGTADGDQARIQCIQRVREVTGCSMKEAKDAVDEEWAARGLSSGYLGSARIHQNIAMQQAAQQVPPQEIRTLGQAVRALVSPAHTPVPQPGARVL